jgi:hypothetical protein
MPGVQNTHAASSSSNPTDAAGAANARLGRGKTVLLDALTRPCCDF